MNAPRGPEQPPQPQEQKAPAAAADRPRSQARPPAGNQLARAPRTELEKPEDRAPRIPGAYRDPQQINNRLEYACRHFHLVSPATAVGMLPEGCAVALQIVPVDDKDVKDGGETYSTGAGEDAKRALSKSALDRIAAAAGISWDPHLCVRLDDGSDPYFCAYRAVGHLRHFDGTEQTLVATKEVDLREGSPQIQSMQARLRQPKSGPKRTIDNQLREMRLHILGHAESKAKNRAIRSLGLKSGYTPAELKKPFVVAKIMWTGHSDDPELKRRFAELTAARMLGGSQALFGIAPVQPAQLPQPSQIPQLMRPPPVGAIGVDPDDDFDPPVVPSRSRPAPPSDPGEQASEPQAKKSEGGPVVKFGRNAGEALGDVPDEDLDWYIKALQGNVADPEKARWKRSNQEALDDALAERKARSEPADEEPEGEMREPGDDSEDFPT